MLQFLLRRTIGALVILLLISAVTFVIFFQLPGDPAYLSCGKNCGPAQIDLIHRNLGLDESIPVQYWEFMKGIFVGRTFEIGQCDAPCLGVSFHSREMVWDTIVDRFPTTLSLTVGGFVVFLVVGLGTGMIAAWKKGTLIDKGFSSLSLVLSSFQIYFLGPIVMGLVVWNHGWLDAPKYFPITDGVGKWFLGLLIPWLVMSTIFTAQYTRLMRSTMIEQLQEEHVRTARAKGMSRVYVFFRYATRGAMIPIVTILGMDLSGLLGGAIVTELTFSLAGIGRLAVESVTNIDLPLTMGVMLVGATFILLLNVVVDAAYAYIDPRVRLG
ncbi:Glutathione transport system permease protein GsiC [Streptomyces sp. RB5]|uniref:Glutathione transport system permease protein GsiC n=1 Tax=Streptomyces smaragdinus TaxID=2585196 RepID=A0A7K0CT81_9ACTN|nr:ABC transporter permease [Streptomyces smaragdinus]MQY16660.1 Glutathione transport system permease protein GsiC [Streptomyces smaragdinus]